MLSFIYVFIYIDILKKLYESHFFLAYVYLAWIRHVNFTWAIEKSTWNKINMKKIYIVLLYSRTSHPFSVNKNRRKLLSKAKLLKKLRLFFRININPFSPNVPFLYPLKTSENLNVFWYFQGVEKGCIGNKWVKETPRWLILQFPKSSGTEKILMSTKTNLFV